MRPRGLMIQGTSSNAGKSLLVAGLARAFTLRGLNVRPFKPQNMSNNAAATLEGAEIGRAQALQARAAKVAPHADMNPVLLKPESERGSQLVLQGKVVGRFDALAYQAKKASLLPAVLESFHRLARSADLVLVEGAGSPAEINLRGGDIANMGFAQAAALPVILLGDIERGGVLAQLVGTVALLEPADRACLVGWIVNKFRGDPTLFASAVPIIEGHTGLPGLGVVAWCDAAADLPKEDALGLDELAIGRKTGARLRIAVLRLPRIANFDDIEPLAMEEAVDLRILDPGQALPGDIDLVILPGSKSTRGDLAALRRAGWDIDIKAHHRRGGHVLGLCGGYQMLGRTIADPLGLEGPAGSDPGLGLLAIDTVLEATKTVMPRQALDAEDGTPLQGYEIHLGSSNGPDRDRPMLVLEGRPEGARSADGRVFGTYLHGLFANDRFRARWLQRLAKGSASELAYEARVEAALDGLAAHLERHLDLDRLLALASPIQQNS
ncbi:adenosylcobyric acid synthase (glutamine-hydrolysing) [Arboricoccus pini]|uniref:Cobyric acid synthase n=1 Tax=Arboricoccus pini TaxID=1963835 RepID=A0A212QXL2_9PROT|nr:cobyric acid synthase [Arboricoccus pini]SNB64467.1 adenosylcobyric acid synthase (glutamine-hydrolysing) [Arboricoccus pini]